MSEMTNQTKEVADGGDKVVEAAVEVAAEESAAAAAGVSEVSNAEVGTNNRKRARDGESSKKQKLTSTTTEAAAAAAAAAQKLNTNTTDNPFTYSLLPEIPYIYNCPPSRPTNVNLSITSNSRVRMHDSLQLGTPNYGDDPTAEARNIMQLVLDHLNREYNARAMANPRLPNVVWEFAGGLHINAFVDNGVWGHINFRAKVVTDSPSSGIGKRGPYLIFGELRRLRKEGVFEVMTCQNLGPVQFAVPRLNGCKACDMAPHRDVLMHGIKGFEVGHTLGFEG